MAAAVIAASSSSVTNTWVFLSAGIDSLLSFVRFSQTDDASLFASVNEGHGKQAVANVAKADHAGLAIIAAHIQPVTAVSHSNSAAKDMFTPCLTRFEVFLAGSNEMSIFGYCINNNNSGVKVFLLVHAQGGRGLRCPPSGVGTKIAATLPDSASKDTWRNPDPQKTPGHDNGPTERYEPAPPANKIQASLA
jgi:hypothetical protein